MSENDDLARRVTRCVPMSFFGMREMLDVGTKKTITVDDIPDVCPEHSVRRLCEKVERNLEKDVFRAVRKSFAPDLWQCWIGGHLWVACMLLQAIILGPFVDALAKNNGKGAIGFGALFFLLAMVSVVAQQRMFYSVPISNLVFGFFPHLISK